VTDDGRQVLNEDGSPVLSMAMHPPSLQHQASMISLRYCVRAMADLSGDSIRRVQERAEQNRERDGLVDEFMAFILGVPVGAGPDSAQNEAAQAGLKLAGASA
jgi:hypothetical protein